MSFITTGLFPLLLGAYLTYKEDYFIAIGCFLVAFCGFRQVYNYIRNQELIKNLESKLSKQQQELNKTNKLIEFKNKEIYLLRNYDYYD